MYQSIVKKAEETYLRDKENQNRKKHQERKSKPSLWPSSLLNCKRKVAYQVLGEKPTLEFSDSSLAYMDGGNVLEDNTFKSLEHCYDVKQSLVLKNDIWSGKADFVIDHLTSKAIIIEHKTTGTSKFRDKTQLPKREHVAQLALYGKLYKELFDITPKLILYYKGWGAWAELELTVGINTINVSGIIANYQKSIHVSKNMRINLKKEIDDLERLYKTVLNGGKLPNRLTSKSSGCEFMGKPSCSFYYSCWGNNG